MNTQHNLYHKGFIKKLRDLRHNDSKSYWSLLNKAVSSNAKQKIIDKVSIDCFVDHFKKLNTVNVENIQDGFEIIDTNTVTGLNTELNALITAKDVLEAIKCLKIIKLVVQI